MMKYLTNLVLSVGLLSSGCKTLDERTMHSYRFGDCSRTSSVTSAVIDVEYTVDKNGQNNGIFVRDETNGFVYRIVRRNNSNNSLELEIYDRKPTISSFELSNLAGGGIH